MSEEIVLVENFDNNNNNNNNDEINIANSNSNEDDGVCSDESDEDRRSCYDQSEAPQSKLNKVIRSIETEITKKGKRTDDSGSASSSSRKRRMYSSKSSSRRRRSSSSFSESSHSSTKSYRRKSKRRRSERSPSDSSRGTYDGLDFELDEHLAPFSCKQCHRGYYTVRELAEHDVRTHDIRVFCALCSKITDSVTKIAAHMLFRHADKPATCHYCGKCYGDKCGELSRSDWEDFRYHIHKEILKRKTNELCARMNSRREDATALRGVGKCPHGAPVKCKNFPTCPGARCIYSHGLCRYDITCNKLSCPFDHTNRPRTCMTCVNDSKTRRR